MKSLTTSEFINRAKLIHGSTYIYDSVKYKGLKKKVTITCSIHGNFEQTPDNHLGGKGCILCGRDRCIQKRTKSISDFVKEANELHSSKYDYSQIKLTEVKATTIIKIRCIKHGEFKSSIRDHLNGKICPECSIKNAAQAKTHTLHEFIGSARKIHGDKYSYKKLVYVNAKEKVIITCKIHGDFEQVPNSHLSGKGCEKCGKKSSSEKQSKEAAKYFEQKADLIHVYKYGYERVNYVNNNTKVLIKCGIHGYFEQTPMAHLVGQGCPACAKSGMRLYEPMTFYVLEVVPIDDSILSSLDSFIGYGITGHFKKRFLSHCTNLKAHGYKVEKVYRYSYTLGHDAKYFEDKIKSFKKAHVEIRVPGFYTEAISIKYKKSFLAFVNRHME